MRKQLVVRMSSGGLGKAGFATVDFRVRANRESGIFSYSPYPGSSPLAFSSGHGTRVEWFQGTVTERREPEA